MSYLTSFLQEPERLMVVHGWAADSIREFWWTGGDGDVGSGTISTQAGLTTVVIRGLTSHFVSVDQSAHVVCAVEGGTPGLVAGSVLDLHWQGSTPASSRNLTRSSGAPLAESDLHSHVDLGTGNRHTFYTAAGHLVEIIEFANGQVSWADLNAQATGAPVVFGPPTGYMSAANQAHHVVARDEESNVVEFTWVAGGQVATLNLGVRTGAPPAYGSLASHMFFEQGTTSHHVFFIDQDGHVREIRWFEDGEPTVHDLHADVAAPIADRFSPISSHVFSNEHTQHVFYQATDGRIVELWE